MQREGSVLVGHSMPGIDVVSSDMAALQPMWAALPWLTYNDTQAMKIYAKIDGINHKLSAPTSLWMNSPMLSSVWRASHPFVFASCRYADDMHIHSQVVIWCFVQIWSDPRYAVQVPM